MDGGGLVAAGRPPSLLLPPPQPGSPPMRADPDDEPIEESGPAVQGPPGDDVPAGITLDGTIPSSTHMRTVSESHARSLQLVSTIWPGADGRPACRTHKALQLPAYLGGGGAGERGCVCKVQGIEGAGV